MVSRRKERPLSPEELKDKLTTTTAPHWLHSEPLCGLSPPVAGITQMISLTEIAEKELLVIVLLDAGDYLTDRMVEVVAEWKSRYRNLGWRPVIVFQQKYIFLKNSRFFDHFKNVSAFNVLPVYLDPDGTWYQHFDSKTAPKIVFLAQGTILFSMSLDQNFTSKIEDIELKLQETFRLEDAGLPLPKVRQTSLKLPLDHAKISSEQTVQTGHWVKSSESLASDDSQAALSFEFEGKSIRLIATTHPKARENTRALILFNDQPLPLIAFGDELHANDKGQAVMEVNRNTGIYEIVQSDTTLKGTLKIKFINAPENPVIFYEVRIA